ncbi:hypothetical protein, partial [Phascolarctobacterium faecium]|uniref:hypothetical protein n=1 Tax=Phascolarctobacterium faecium TaxID=33025 RepID=UPI003AF1BE93
MYFLFWRLPVYSLLIMLMIKSSKLQFLVEAVAARFPDRMFWQVRGNGDFALGSAGLLYAREETLGGK